MGKEKETLDLFFQRIVDEYKGEFRTDGKVLFCLMCDCEVAAKQKSQVKQHRSTAKHLAGGERKSKDDSSKKTQALLTTMNMGGDVNRNVNKFAMDLTKAFIQSNIPLYTIRHPSMVNFLETHTKYGVPSETTLRNKCLPKIYEECMTKMKDIAKNNYLWVSMDETTDSEERYVVNFIFGVLGVERERDRSYLFASKVLEKVNHTTMAAFFDECVNELSKQ